MEKKAIEEIKREIITGFNSCIDLLKIERLIEELLDKAREEGRREAIEETNRTLGTNVKYIDGEYKVVFRRVSKLLKQ